MFIKAMYIFTSKLYCTQRKYNPEVDYNLYIDLIKKITLEFVCIVNSEKIAGFRSSLIPHGQDPIKFLSSPLNNISYGIIML